MERNYELIDAILQGEVDPVKMCNKLLGEKLMADNYREFWKFVDYNEIVKMDQYRRGM